MYGQVELLYYIIVTITMLYAFYRMGVSKYSVLIVLVFWSGLFSFVGTEIYSIYKILIVVYTFYLFYNRIFKKKEDIEIYVNIIFLVFSVIFWLSYGINGGGLLTILSQYLYKFGFPFLIFHGFKDIVFKVKKRERLKYLLLQVLYIQVFLSIVKLMMFGFNVEGIVGSIEYNSGAFAVVIPIASLFFYWVIKKSNLKNEEWLILLSFFLIAIASGKRAPVLMFPVFVLLLYYYTGRRLNLKSILKYAPIMFVILYLGVRLTPTLNPEREVWGSFDAEHIVYYVVYYNFGVSDFREIDFEANLSGRGGGLLLLLKPERLGFSNPIEFMFGHGLYAVTVREGGRFTGSGDYLLQHEGLVGEIIRLYYSLGLLGVLSIFMLALFILKSMKDVKTRRLLILYFLWDLFMYNNHFMFGNTTSLIVIFTIYFSNSFYNKPIYKVKNETTISS